MLEVTSKLMEVDDLIVLLNFLNLFTLNSFIQNENNIYYLRTLMLKKLYSKMLQGEESKLTLYKFNTFSQYE